jgi:hypothetical protein
MGERNIGFVRGQEYLPVVYEFSVARIRIDAASIDLHARFMYVCTLSHDGEILVHCNMKAAPEPFLKAVAPYYDGLVVAVECVFTWVWLANLCAGQGIPFVLGHALYMKAIHCGTAQMCYNSIYQQGFRYTFCTIGVQSGYFARRVM